MGQGQHKIKRKAEQIACNEAIEIIKNQSNDLLFLEQKEQINEKEETESENITLKIIDL